MKLARHFLILFIAVTAMTGCTNTATNHCPVGQEVVIPASDTSDPAVVMDFHLPNGTIVTVTPGSGVSTVPVPGGGRVTVIVNAKDSEGVQDAQIWAASITTKIDTATGTATKSGPALLTAATTSNRDSGSAGQKGCTERLATTNLEVSKSPAGSVSFEVHAVAVNFQGGKATTPLVTLVAQ
jgi:hypothetical protein